MVFYVRERYEKKVMSTKIKRIVSLMLCLIMAAMCFASCGDDKSSGEKSEPILIEMSVKEHGVMKLELYPDIAPETVANFVDLVKQKFYDGLTFHRIMTGFMIQGGDPDGNGSGGSKNTIKGEFMENGFYNALSHTRGVISMARSQDYNSASSQFFICHSDTAAYSLDGKYAAFGKVIEGFDVLDSIANVEVVANFRGEMSVPVHTVYIDYVKVIEE